MSQSKMKLFFLCFVLLIHNSAAGQIFSVNNLFKSKPPSPRLPSSRISTAVITTAEMESAIAMQNLERIATMENAIARNINNPSRIRSMVTLQHLDRIAQLDHEIPQNVNRRLRPLSFLSADSISMQTANSHPEINAAINSQSKLNKLIRVDRKRLGNYGKNTAIALAGIGGALTISNALQTFDSNVLQNITKMNENEEKAVTTYESVITTTPEVRHSIGNDWD